MDHAQSWRSAEGTIHYQIQKYMYPNRLRYDEK